MKKLILCGLLSVTAGCSTVTINPKGQSRFTTEPTYEKSLPFYLAGIVGERTVDVKKICGDRAVKQVQTQDTFLDSFLDIITLSIYTPQTIKVWCAAAGT